MKKIFLFIIVYAFISFPILSQDSVSNPIVNDSTNPKILKNIETYVTTMIDESDQLCINTSDERKIIIKKDTEQVAFEDIKISEDGSSVGWLAYYPNSATSYPIPLVLKIYSQGMLHEFRGNGLPVWKWKYHSDGEQVCFEQETVHGGFGIHYELHNIASEKLIASYEPEYGPDNRVLEIQRNIPNWVIELNNEAKK